MEASAARRGRSRGGWWGGPTCQWGVDRGEETEEEDDDHGVSEGEEEGEYGGLLSRADAWVGCVLLGWVACTQRASRWRIMTWSRI